MLYRFNMKDKIQQGNFLLKKINICAWDLILIFGKIGKTDFFQR